MTQMVRIIINGRPESFEAPLNLYDILEQEEMIGMMVAVARNSEVVPKAQWTETTLEEGDEIEIVAPMQGG